MLDQVWGPVAETALPALAKVGETDDETSNIEDVQIDSRVRTEARLLYGRRIRIIERGNGSASTTADSPAAITHLLVQRRRAGNSSKSPVWW
ncbi:hypothetical protein [Nocardia salmonicida]|uniref:hypothetical protein n=1 Tax=Nocardia salmonicida TaxID=53431 RepID=UPI00362A946C